MQRSAWLTQRVVSLGLALLLRHRGDPWFVSCEISNSPRAIQRSALLLDALFHAPVVHADQLRSKRPLNSVS